MHVKHMARKILKFITKLTSLISLNLCVCVCARVCLSLQMQNIIYYIFELLCQNIQLFIKISSTQEQNTGLGHHDGSRDSKQQNKKTS